MDTTPTPFVLPPLEDPPQDSGNSFLSEAPPYSDTSTISAESAPPNYATQFIFTSKDVLNSSILQANSSKEVFHVESSQGGILTSIRGAEGKPLADVLWSHDKDSEPQLNLDFKGKTVSLKKFMTRSNTFGILFIVHYQGSVFDVYRAGPALGIRLHGTTSMLAGIRDPYKNVEIVVSPEGIEQGACLPAAVIISVLLKSERSLGKDFEQRNTADKIWHGIDYMFRSVGRDTVLDQGPAAGVGKQRLG